MRSVLTIVAVLLAMSSPTVAAGATGFTAPVRVDSRITQAAPSIAVRNGRTWIAFDGAQWNRKGIHLATNTSGSWVVKRVTSQMDILPSLALDANGRPHIAFVRVVTSCSDLVCAQPLFYARPGTAGWAIEKVAGGETYSPSIDLAPNGQPRIAWYQSGGGGRYAERIGGAWITQKIDLDCCDGMDAGDGGGPVLDIATDGTPWVSYARPGAGELVLAFRQGGTWFKAPIRDDDAYGFDLAIDSGEKAHVVYRRLTGTDRGTWYGTNANGAFTWTKATGARASAPAIALVSGGGVGIVVDGASGLVYAEGDASGFTPVALTSNDGPDEPDIAATASGKVRVAFSRSGSGGTGQRGVFFTRQP